VSRKVRIQWNCPCGERHRWKHDREETEYSPPMGAMTCDVCRRTSKVRLRTVKYEVTE
jgi:hypothetical protein